MNDSTLWEKVNHLNENQIKITSFTVNCYDNLLMRTGKAASWFQGRYFIYVTSMAVSTYIFDIILSAIDGMFIFIRPSLWFTAV